MIGAAFEQDRKCSAAIRGAVVSPASKQTHVGTTSPSANLEVTGAIKATSAAPSLILFETDQAHTNGHRIRAGAGVLEIQAEDADGTTDGDIQLEGWGGASLRLLTLRATDTTITGDVAVSGGLTANNIYNTSDWTRSVGAENSEGYVKMPNGVILQWGTISGMVSGATASLTLPIAFPNSHISGVASPTKQSAVTGAHVGYYEPTSKSTADVTHDTVTSSANSDISWFAIGY